MQMMHDYVLIELLEKKEKEGSIFLPQISQKQTLAKVKAVGPGRVNERGVLIPTEVKVGDVIMYNQQYDNYVMIDNVKHPILLESEILGVLENFE